MPSPYQGKAFFCLVFAVEKMGGITKILCDTEEEMTSKEEQSVSTVLQYRSKMEDEKVIKAN